MIDDSDKSSEQIHFYHVVNSNSSDYSYAAHT